MSKKYVTHSYGDPITEIDIEKETSSCVWIKGRRQNKISDYESFFDTPEEAKEWIISKANQKVLMAEHQLKYANDMLTNEIKRLEKCKLITPNQ